MKRLAALAGAYRLEDAPPPVPDPPPAIELPGNPGDVPAAPVEDTGVPASFLADGEYGPPSYPSPLGEGFTNSELVRGLHDGFYVHRDAKRVEGFLKAGGRATWCPSGSLDLHHPDGRSLLLSPSATAKLIAANLLPRHLLAARIVSDGRRAAR